MLKNFIKIFALSSMILLSNACATTRTVPQIYKFEQPKCADSVDRFLEGIHNDIPQLKRPTPNEVIDMLECVELLRSYFNKHEIN